MNGEILKPALWTKEYLALTLSNAFSSFGFYMLATILSKHLVDLGNTLAVAGAIVGLFSIAALVVRPVSGVIADRFDKRVLLIVSYLLIGLFSLGYVVSTNIQLFSVFRVFHGAAFCISGTSSIALAGEILPKSRMGEGVGFLGLGQIVASAVAPGLGIAISNASGFESAILCSCIFAVCASALLVLIKPSKKAVVKKVNGVKQKISMRTIFAKEVLGFSMIAGIFSFINGVVASFLLLVAEERSIGNISIYFTVYAVFMLLSRLTAGRVMDRKGLSVFLYPCFIAGFIGLILHGLAGSLWMFLLAAMLRAFSQGSIQPSLQAASLKLVDADRVGVATSTFCLGGDVGQGIGPVVGGTIATRFGYGAMFYFCSFLLLVGCFVFWIHRKPAREFGKNRVAIGESDS